MKKTDNMIFIWDFFKVKGLSDYGIAGLMGNLYAESGLGSNVLERLCIKRYAEIGINFTDELYTRSVDNGAINEAEFLSPMGKHYGYGLAQWTTESRKRGLYDYCKAQNVSISDLKAQCEYLYSELETSFKTVLSVLKTAQNINSASDKVLLKFEAPKDAELQIETRRKYSKEIYDLMTEGNMLTADKVLNEAMSWDGYCEKKNASNLGDNTPEGKIVNAGENNYTIFTKHLRESTGELKIYPQPAQWCDIYCDDILLRVCIREYGYEKGLEVCKNLLGGWSAYTPTSASYYKKIGRWSEKPQRGAQIFFKNSTRIHHTGWVLKAANRVYTIEGNTNSGPYVVSNGGQVRCKDYALDDPCIAGYGLPEYGKEVITYPCWIKSGDDFYYRLSEGVNAHGWRDIKCGDGNTYRFYFDSKGKMLTDWQQIDGKWYYFHPTKGSGREGAMYISDANGAQFIAKF